MSNEILLKQLEASDVSEAAKEFYRKRYLPGYRVGGGWNGEEYDLIKELDVAGLVKVEIIFADCGDNPD